ncbi:MAG: methionine aminotransferase [Bacteroidota bacterium]
MITVESKLPKVGTTIFTVMSQLAHQQQAINLSQGFPNFDCAPALKKLVHQAMLEGKNQYAPMTGVAKLRHALAEKANRLYGANLDPDQEITITAGATQALFTAISAFVRPGDEVILVEPAYDSYGPAVEVNGGVVVPYELEGPDYRVDWEKLGQLVTAKTRMLVVNTPHNPTGQVFSEADFTALKNILSGTNIILLCDEVYEHLVYNGHAHRSVVGDPELFARSIATYSFGKTFHNTGWKCGYAAGPAHLMAEFRKVHQFNVFSVNTPVQYALGDYLKDPEVYEYLGPFFQKKRDLFLELIEGTGLHPIPCQGTYFQLVDYSAVSDLKEVDFARWLTTEIGVAAIPVSVFYTNQVENKVVRFCFAKTDDVLEAAGKRLRTL